MKELSSMDKLFMSKSDYQLRFMKELCEQQKRIADSLEIICKKLNQ